jgi:hypothetical protein
MNAPLENPIILKRESQNSFIILQGNTRLTAALRCVPQKITFPVRVEGEGDFMLDIKKLPFPQQPYREAFLRAKSGAVEPIRFLVN